MKHKRRKCSVYGTGCKADVICLELWSITERMLLSSGTLLTEGGACIKAQIMKHKTEANPANLRGCIDEYKSPESNKLRDSRCANIGLSVGWSTILTQIETSKQILNVLLWRIDGHSWLPEDAAWLQWSSDISSEVDVAGGVNWNEIILWWKSLRGKVNVFRRSWLIEFVRTILLVHVLD